MKLANEAELTAGKNLAWNSLLNLGTGIFIVGLNIVFVPLMLHAFGIELYGVLAITWIVLANFSWLDFGFSRASAKYVAMELALGRQDQAVIWTWTAVVSQAFLGFLGALVLWFLAPLIVDHIHVQQQNRDLVILTLKLFAFSIPIDFANRSISGVLQAGQRFDWSNGLGLLNTLSTFAVYGFGILRGSDFRTVIYGLFILRVVNLLASYWGATHVLPSLKSLSWLGGFTAGYPSRAIVLVRYGWWVASASIVGPLLFYFDQWVISVIVGVALLPYYTVPSNLLLRLGIFPQSLTSTLFPAFSAMEAKTEWSRIQNYYVRAHRYLLTVILPILFVVFTWGKEILRVWIGPEFSARATLPLKILVVGFAVGLLAPLSGTLLESVGRPDILVKLYLVELPANVAIVWFLTKHFGISGAALSYTVRAIIDTMVLWIVVYRIVPFSASELLQKGLLRPALSIPVFTLAAYCLRAATIQNYFQIGTTLALLAAYGLCACFLIFDRKDRSFAVELYRTNKNKFLDKIRGRPAVLTGAENS